MRLALASALVLAGSLRPVAAVETRWALETAARLALGRADGLAISSGGRLSLAPEVVAENSLASLSADAYGWDVLPDRDGRLLLATGPEGRLFEVAPAGDPRVLLRAEEPMITALAWMRDGSVLAGTAPEGRIYRIGRDGQPKLWAETGERYIWGLVVADDGTTYAATGERGRIIALDERGRGEVLFDSDEHHIVALALARDGSLLAGGAGRGLLYRVDRNGRAEVLHQDVLPEVRAIAEGEDGTIWFATLAPPPLEPRAPAVRIRLPEPNPVLPGGAAADSGDRVLEGVIEGLAPPGAAAPPFRGRLLRLRPGQQVREIWRSEEQAVYALALDARGSLYFGAGEPARLYRVGEDDEVLLVAAWAQAQVTRLRAAGDGLLAATSNPAALYRIRGSQRLSGRFEAAPLDAGTLARWGQILWRVEGRARVHLETRTGNSAEPDGSWSAWQAVRPTHSGGGVASPPGRYLQWRLRLEAESPGDHPVLSDLRIAYRPRNQGPQIESFELQGTHHVQREVTLRWKISDPDGDALAIHIEFRREEGGPWVRFDPPTAEPTATFPWSVADLDEGRYSARLVVSDRPANEPDEAMEARSARASFTVDRTPPVLAAEGGWLVARDALSPILWAQWVGPEGRASHRLAVQDGVADGQEEKFELPRETEGRTRVSDASGNVAEWPP